MITSYTFGNITIDGRAYASDLIIFPDGRILENWRRQSGHLLTPADLAVLTDEMEKAPGLIIAGTGAQGRMVPARDLEPCLAEKNIRLEVLDTLRAVDLYNQLVSRGRAPGACFHLTC